MKTKLPSVTVAFGSTVLLIAPAFAQETENTRIDVKEKSTRLLLTQDTFHNPVHRL